MEIYIIALLPLKDGYLTQYWAGDDGLHQTITPLYTQARRYTWHEACATRDVLRREPGLKHPESIVVTH